MDYQLTSAIISMDEESPYISCEIEFCHYQSYVYFERDRPFSLHLFGTEYSFVVDTRTLNRTIDAEGNLSKVFSVTGLSPLCLKAKPRAKALTKTWDVPTMASDIVQELIGPVTWNLVDWMIPAYRLAAEHAYPLDIAQQIVNAVGGLIESQPDGSVMCRHCWPVSISALDTVAEDVRLDETQIYAITESPTNDDLVNRVRILDQDASYQDKLEYVPNKNENGEEDKLNGILYAYLSPWREGMKMVTTRPSAIEIGMMTEGTRRIELANSDHPAELITFSQREGSTQYPVMQLNSVEWLDEDLGGVTVNPYSTTLSAGKGSYDGYSLANVEYTTRFLMVPVQCLEQSHPIEAQFLLIGEENGNV